MFNPQLLQMIFKLFSVEGSTTKRYLPPGSGPLKSPWIVSLSAAGKRVNLSGLGFASFPVAKRNFLSSSQSVYPYLGTIFSLLSWPSFCQYLDVTRVQAQVLYFGVFYGMNIREPLKMIPSDITENSILFFEILLLLGDPNRFLKLPPSIDSKSHLLLFLKQWYSSSWPLVQHDSSQIECIARYRFLASCTPSSQGA